MEINSGNIRAVLMYYYRFKRQFSCCSEVKTDFYELSDLLVDTGSKFIEIEIKCSKHDLIKGEARKEKHKRPNESRLINEFYVCVPTELVEDAKLWIAQINPSYGLIEFRSEIAKKDFVKYEDFIKVHFDAKILQPKYHEFLKNKMIKRLSSALTSEYIGKIK
jgi:hypothetical protein